MKPPKNINFPFFAYGLFRPGQLGFIQLRDLVATAVPGEVPGLLLVRDGLPIIDPEGAFPVRGAFLEFKSDAFAEAYERISDMESDQHYLWAEASVHGQRANILRGRSPRKGGVPLDEEWDCWNDPLFTSASILAGLLCKTQ